MKETTCYNSSNCFNLVVVLGVYENFTQSVHDFALYFIYLFFTDHNALFILFYFIILLYNTVLVLPYIDMNLPQVYIVKDYLYLLSLSSIFAFSHEPTRSFIFTTVSNRLLPNLAMASKLFIPITDTHIDVSATLTHFDCFSFRYFF